MRCSVNLINETNNKVLKSEKISKDTYSLCEETVKKETQF